MKRKVDFFTTIYYNDADKQFYDYPADPRCRGSRVYPQTAGFSDVVKILFQKGYPCEFDFGLSREQGVPILKGTIRYYLQELKDGAWVYPSDIGFLPVSAIEVHSNGFVECCIELDKQSSIQILRSLREFEWQLRRWVEMVPPLSYVKTVDTYTGLEMVAEYNQIYNAQESIELCPTLLPNMKQPPVDIIRLYPARSIANKPPYVEPKEWFTTLLKTNYVNEVYEREKMEMDFI